VPRSAAQDQILVHRQLAEAQECILRLLQVVPLNGTPLPFKH
jgi:hypothetical protein